MNQPDMQSAAHRFFRTPTFAVVGASQDTSKFGYRILQWYHAHSLPVTPINPRAPSISVKSPFPYTSKPPQSYPTVATASALPSPSTTALSFLTPPSITLKVLREAKEAGVKAVWLQPGSFDEEAMRYAVAEFESAVGGFGGGTVGGEGWCVLVDGERVLDEVEREWKGDGGKL